MQNGAARNPTIGSELRFIMVFVWKELNKWLRAALGIGTSVRLRIDRDRTGVIAFCSHRCEIKLFENEGPFIHVAYRLFSGEIFVDGREVRIHTADSKPLVLFPASYLGYNDFRARELELYPLRLCARRDRNSKCSFWMEKTR